MKRDGKITMAEKARFFRFKAKKAEAKKEALLILHKLVRVQIAAIPPAHPKVMVSNV
jgi:hypothetical protein